MRVTTTSGAPEATGADTIAVGVFEGEVPADGVAGGAVGALLESGEARASLRHLALARHEGRRWLVVGLGAREDFDAERARVAAATVVGRGRELGTRALCWVAPEGIEPRVAAGLVEGCVLGAYRYDAQRSAPPADPGGPEELALCGAEGLEAPAERATILAEHACRARDLANAPGNVLTPSALAEHCRTLEGVDAEVEGREGIEARGMGAFAAVARGSAEEPALITLRHEPTGARGPVLGLVGKAVTFDTGGISIKGRNKMSEMKFDMAGGAAVVEAVAAIARLGLPLRIVGVVGATENMPSGRAFKPGDVLRAMNGTTIEVIDTDAEGRLVLADCLAHAVALGAERLVDVATLTGAIVTTFGSAYAGLMADDDAWAAEVEAAGARAGERVWRLPLSPDYDELVRGTVADLANTTEPRQAGSILGATFLRRFTGDVPWAHLDIAGTAWGLKRPYADKGASGFGVRLLAELAEALSAA